MKPSEFPVETQDEKSCSWFKAMRSRDARELIRKNPLAYVLASIIACRARWSEGFNADGIELGEALLGDHDEYGMTRQQYRTALAQLIRANFITIKSTSRGTVARLIDTRLFDPLNIEVNHQKHHRSTSPQPPTNQCPTTNYNEYKDNKEKEGERSAPRFQDGLTDAQRISLERKEQRKQQQYKEVCDEIERIKANAAQDATGTRFYDKLEKERLRLLKPERARLKAELGVI